MEDDIEVKRKIAALVSATILSANFINSTSFSANICARKSGSSTNNIIINLPSQWSCTLNSDGSYNCNPIIVPSPSSAPIATPNPTSTGVPTPAASLMLVPDDNYPVANNVTISCDYLNPPVSAWVDIFVDNKLAGTFSKSTGAVSDTKLMTPGIHQIMCQGWHWDTTRSDPGVLDLSVTHTVTVVSPPIALHHHP